MNDNKDAPPSEKKKDVFSSVDIMRSNELWLEEQIGFQTDHFTPDKDGPQSFPAIKEIQEIWERFADTIQEAHEELKLIEQNEPKTGICDEYVCAVDHEHIFPEEEEEREEESLPESQTALMRIQLYIKGLFAQLFKSPSSLPEQTSTRYDLECVEERVKAEYIEFLKRFRGLLTKEGAVRDERTFRGLCIFYDETAHIISPEERRYALQDTLYGSGNQLFIRLELRDKKKEESS
jgi:hypothetical protein